MNEIKIELDTSRLDQMIREIPERADMVLDKIAFDVERVAKPLTNVETGALRNSIYVSGASGGGTSYAGASSEAKALRPKAGIVPEVRPSKRFERVIGASVNYAYWQELIHPFLVPAVEQVRPQAQKEWKKLFE